MTSLGSSALRYMTLLKPALEARGYELAVFHTTGMGGRAFEDLAQGPVCCGDGLQPAGTRQRSGGSCVTAGADRLRGAGRAGVPQIVAPGATDMVDFATWATPPRRFGGRAVHEHNRLIASVCVDPPMRREVARAIGERLAEATGPTCLLLPTQGIEAWDRPGEPLHDPEGLTAFVDELPRSARRETQLIKLDAHINDAAFAEAALDVFDGWVRWARWRQAGLQSRPPDMKPQALILDFGGVITRTLFESHALTEANLGLAPGTLTWRGPFDPAGDALWRDMQADRISERDYWLARTREVGLLVGEEWDRMESFVRRARGADLDGMIRPEAVAAIEAAKAAGVGLALLSNELDLFYGADLRDRLALLQRFDVIVDASDSHILKPDPRAYYACLEALDLPAAACVSSTTNCATSRALNAQACAQCTST